jgi:PAT family beta-lactamase induction signal transducer AmpG
MRRWCWTTSPEAVLKPTLERWGAALAAYADPQVRSMLLLGLSSGLPFPLVLTTLSARLRQAGIDRTTIGYFSLVGLAYSLKYFWAPVVDRLPLPGLRRLGRRRSWMLLAQCGIAVGVMLMASHDPHEGAAHFALLAVFTAFWSATQDIAVDAWRIEAVATDRQGAMAAAYQTGYQIALIAAGAGALVAASNYGWAASYTLMAALMGIGITTTLLTAEPRMSAQRQASYDPALLESTLRRLTPRNLAMTMLATAATWAAISACLALLLPSLSLAPVFGVALLFQALVLVLSALPPLHPALKWLTIVAMLPVVDFFVRQGWRLALPMLGLLITYRLNYSTMGAAANPFYIDMGYSLDQIALVSKVYGVLMTLAGALVAGLLVKRIGIPRTLLIGWLLLTVANLFYSYFATLHHPGTHWLAAAVSFDNIGNGIAGTAFIAWMSSLTNTAYTATQYALFGMLWSLPAKSIASQWGRIVDAFGYPPFFVYTAAVGLPALLLILWLMRRLPVAAAEA